MKKIFFIVFLFIMSTIFCHAQTLVMVDTPYYVKIKKGSEDYKLLNVKKVYDKDTLGVVFKVDYDDYNVDNNFNVYADYNYNIWKKREPYIHTFDCATYYYNLDPTLLNYYFTQYYIWNFVFGYSTIMTDSLGNEIDTYKKDYDKFYQMVGNHITKPDFFGKTYDVELYSTKTFRYTTSSPILEDPVVEGFDIHTENKVISIKSNKVGSYKIYFRNIYEQDNKCYSDGTNVYWQNLKGPGNLEYYIKLNVLGTKVFLEENLVGVNNKFGDAYLNSEYALYKDGEEITSITEKEYYVPRNSSYILKDISNDVGIKKTEDINFSVTEEDYTIKIDKYVISKKVSFSIPDENNYYVYLKSNNELYAEINKDDNTVVLPFGTYYIKDDEEILKYFSIEDEVDENIIIEEKKEEIIPNLDKDISDNDNNNNNENKDDNNNNNNKNNGNNDDDGDNKNKDNENNNNEVFVNDDFFVEEEILYEDIFIEDESKLIKEEIPIPYTNDNIFQNIWSFLISLILIIYSIKNVKKCQKDNL